MKLSRITMIAVAGITLLPIQQSNAQLRRYANQVGRIVNQVQKGQDRHDDHGPPRRDSNHHQGHSPPPKQPRRDTHIPKVIHLGNGHHVDHHDHVVRDSHGHIIGRYHHDVIHKDALYVVPHIGIHMDSYYVRNGQYYYTPQTASRTQVVNRPIAMQFGGFSHVDDLASRLEELTNEFLLDLHYNYQHNPGFAQTYAEGYELLQVSKYIRAAEHAQDRNAIQARLGGMDALFHHLEGDVRGWSRRHQRQVGELGILSKMEMIESTLHHLMHDVGVGQVSDVIGQEVAPPPADVPPGPLMIAPLPGL